MIITFSSEQQQKLEPWAQRVMATELYDGVRDPCYTLSVSIGLDGKGCAKASSYSDILDLGAVSIKHAGYASL